MRVLFLGPPAAGKGTQAEKVHEQLDIPLVVTGDILRKAVKSKNAVGIEAEEYMKKGELVPDQLVIKIITNRLEEEDCRQKGFLLDGFPRTSEQAKTLDRELAKKNLSLDKVVYFSIRDEICIERISGRRNCRQCGAVYHLKNKPPKIENKCDRCSGVLVQRMDDTAEVMTTRLKTYHEKTAPLLTYYQQKNIVEEINAEQPIEEVLREAIEKTTGNG